MERVREPLVIPAVCFAAGIAAFGALEPEVRSLGGGLTAVAGLWILAGLSCPARTRWICGLTFVFLAGCLCAALQRDGPDPELDAQPGETLLLAGCVAGPAVSDGIQLRFPLELEPGARARITLTTRPGETLPRVGYGDQVEVTAPVRRPRNFRNPGAFDFVAYLRRDQVYWLASARGVEHLTVTAREACGSASRRWALQLREWLAQRIARQYRQDESASRLMPALLVGDNSRLYRSETEEYRRTGTYHAIVISGLHIGVVAGVVYRLLQITPVGLGVRMAAAMAVAWGYAAVADWQPPVVRSALGFSLFLASAWWFRRGRLLNLLGATALALMVATPEIIYDPSFQLTFLSVAAIGGLASPLVEQTFGPLRSALSRLDHIRTDPRIADPRAGAFRLEMRLAAQAFGLPGRAVEWILRLWFGIVEMAVVSACVQLALLALMVSYFHQASVTTVLANLMAVPPLTLAVPVGLAAAITDWRWLAWCAGQLVHIGQWFVSFWALLEPGWRVPDPPVALIFALLASVAAAAVALLCAERKAWLLLPAMATVCVICWPAPRMEGQLELTAIDVGQGDSLLVVFPNGETLLVDGGGFPSFDTRVRPRLDIGEDVVSPYLWRRGIRRLDYVAVTHLHDDHAGGLPAVIRNFRPREVWTGARPRNGSAALEGILTAARETGASALELREGDGGLHGGAELRVLAPARGWEADSVARNNDSLVVLLTMGRRRFLLMGDAERAVEESLAKRGLLPEVDVLKVGHHGSKTSSTPEFLGIARPLFALISAGADNTYGHPAQQILARLRSTGARAVRTDQSGLITIRTDGRRLTVYQ